MGVKSRATFRDRADRLICVERQILEEFQELCWRERKSFNLKINELMTEELQKNALGVENPIRVNYNFPRHSNNRKKKPCLTIPLDHFIKVPQEAESLSSEIQTDLLHVCYANVRIMFRKMSARAHGRIPDV